MNLFLSTFATSYWSHFSKKNLKFEKRKKKFSAIPTSKGPFEIFFFKIKFFHFFTNKTYFFYMNLNSICSELYLSYITWDFSNFSKFHFFTLEFLSITKFFLWPLTAERIIKKIVFDKYGQVKTKIFNWKPFWVISMQIGCLKEHLARAHCSKGEGKNQNLKIQFLALNHPTGCWQSSLSQKMWIIALLGLKNWTCLRGIFTSKFEIQQIYYVKWWI